MMLLSESDVVTDEDPVAERLILPVNPPRLFNVIVDEPEEPT
jgi:hypothetical protein